MTTTTSRDHAMLFIDAHTDIPNPLEKFAAPGEINAGTAIDLEHLIRGGVTCVVIAASVVRGEATPAGIEGDMAVLDAKIGAVREIASNNPDKAVFAQTAAEIVEAGQTGKTAIMLSVLGVHGLGSDLSAVDRLFDRGVRIIGMTHIGNTAFADSSRPYGNDVADQHGGLSALGREAVARANNLGMLLDVSQLSPAALLQTISLSKCPVIATHSGIRTLVDHPRNLSDEELDAIAAAGGVVGIVAFSSYLRNLTNEEIVAREKVGEQYGGLKNGYAGLSVEDRQAYYAALTAVTKKATLAEYVMSIDYAVKRAGIDHVTLSSDFNQGGGIVGWMSAEETPNVIQALRDHGYGDDEVAKLCGGNFLRILRAAEQNADSAALAGVGG